MALWIPSTARGDREYLCRLCGERFDRPAAYAHHCAKCVKTNEERVRMLSPRTRLPEIYDPERWDAEYETAVATRSKVAPDGSWSV